MDDLAGLHAVVSRITQRTPDKLDITLWQPTEHQSNHTYQIRFDDTHWIAKVYLKPAEYEDAPRREVESLRLLANYDIAPQLILHEPHTDTHKPIVIYEYMAGEMWDRNKPSANDLAQLADLWLTMNRIPVDGSWLSRGMERTGEQIAEQFQTRFQEYADWTQAQYPPAIPTAQRLIDLAQQAQPILDELAPMPPVLAFSRADPRFANIITRPDNRLGMVDWEDAGLRDTARDIADLMTHCNQEDLLTQDEWDAFLNPYLAERRQYDPDIEQRVQLYHAVFPLFWLSVLTAYGIRLWKQQGNLNGWTVNSMPANHRLRRYLARAIAYPQLEFDKQLDDLADVTFFDTGSHWQ